MLRHVRDAPREGHRVNAVRSPDAFAVRHRRRSRCGLSPFPICLSYGTTDAKASSILLIECPVN